MKKLTIVQKLLLVLLSVCPSFAFSSEVAVTLKDGKYYQINRKYCDLYLLYDEASNGSVIYLQGISVNDNPCGDTSLRKLSKVPNSKNVFVLAETSILTKEQIEKCKPTNEDKIPCGAHYYDPKTGNLLIQEGDSFSNELRMQALNSGAFLESSGIVNRRGGTVIFNKQLGESFLFKFYN